MNQLNLGQNWYQIAGSYAELSRAKQAKVAAIALGQLATTSALVRVLMIIRPWTFASWINFCLKPYIYSRQPWRWPIRWAENLQYASTLAMPFFLGQGPIEFPAPPPSNQDLVGPNVEITEFSFAEFIDLQVAFEAMRTEESRANKARLAAILYRRPGKGPNGDQRIAFVSHQVDQRVKDCILWPDGYYTICQLWLSEQMTKIAEGYPKLIGSESTNEEREPTNWLALVGSLAGLPTEYQNVLETPTGFILNELNSRAIKHDQRAS